MLGPKPIPFESFMQHALHDPKHGYYARRIQGVGGRGDFTTAPMLSDALAKAIASWATQALRKTGCRNLIEIGPGEGTLSSAVWKHLPWTLKLRCKLHLVESSQPLTKIQQAHLGRKARWHESPQQALDACHGNAVIFSNELVDAFPVRRFEKSDTDWQEIAVSKCESGIITEWLMPPAPLPDSTSFLNSHPVGQKIEVHESYKTWLQAWLPQWKHGRMLTIDYGDAANTLYHRRPNGTLRAYLLQHRLEGPAIYDNIGRQDITADVNFTDLIRWSKDNSLNHQIQTLTEFFAETATQEDQQLTSSDGAGTAFKVLEQIALNPSTDS